MSNFSDFAGGFGLSAVGSLADFGLNSLQQKQNLKYAKKMAQFQSDLNKKVWQEQTLENAMLQKQGLQNAGYSVAGMENGFGNINGVGDSGASVAQSTPFGDFTNSSLVQSQINLNKAQEKKTLSEADIFKADAEVRSDMNKLELAYKDALAKGQKVQVDLLGQSYEFNEKIQPKYIADFDFKWNQIDADVKLKTSQKEYQDKVNDTFEQKFETDLREAYSRIQKNLADVSLSSATAKEILTLLEPKRLLMDAQKTTTENQGSLMSRQKLLMGTIKSIADKNYDLLQKYGDSDKWFNYINGSISTIIDGVGTFLDYKSLGKGSQTNIERYDAFGNLESFESRRTN